MSWVPWLLARLTVALVGILARYPTYWEHVITSQKSYLDIVVETRKEWTASSSTVRLVESWQRIVHRQCRSKRSVRMLLWAISWLCILSLDYIPSSPEASRLAASNDCQYLWAGILVPVTRGGKHPIRSYESSAEEDRFSTKEYTPPSFRAQQMHKITSPV